MTAWSTHKHTCPSTCEQDINCNHVNTFQFPSSPVRATSIIFINTIPELLWLEQAHSFVCTAVYQLCPHYRRTRKVERTHYISSHPPGISSLNNLVYFISLFFPPYSKKDMWPVQILNFSSSDLLIHSIFIVSLCVRHCSRC